MNQQTRSLLKNISDEFYRNHANSFSQTRSYPWLGWSKLVDHLRKYQLIGNKGLRVLDLGCGNGRFLKFMIDQDIQFHSYVGLDNNLDLLNLAKNRFNQSGVNWEYGDILNYDLTELNKSESGFDLIVVFGLLHHVPGYEHRLHLIQRLFQVKNDSGLLALSLWQPQLSVRFKRLAISWDRYNKARNQDLKINVDDLEVGDYLLKWQGSADFPRYIHVFEESEINRFKHDLGQHELVTEYEADGKEGRLNHYLVYS